MKLRRTTLKSLLIKLVVLLIVLSMIFAGFVVMFWK